MEKKDNAPGGAQETETKIVQNIENQPKWMKKDALSTGIKRLNVEHLQPALQRYANAVADGYNVPLDMVVAEMYSVAGGAIGQRIQVKFSNYSNAPCLWTCIVGCSGTGKTPTINEVQKPLEVIHADYKAEHRELMDAWRKCVEQGEEPQRKKAYITASTPESLYKELESQPQGLTMVKDELSGLFEAFGHWGKSDEVQHLLSIWSNQALEITRSTKQGYSIERPYLSILGGTQPTEITRVMRDERFTNSGLLARWLWCYPDSLPPKKGQAPKVPEHLQEYWRVTVTKLHQMTPMEVTLSPEAANLYFDFEYECKSNAQSDSTFMGYYWNKLPIHVLRWLIVAHSLNDNSSFVIPKEIDSQTMQIAIEDMAVFAKWARKVEEQITASEKLKKTTVLNNFMKCYPIRPGCKPKFAECCEGLNEKMLSPSHLNR